MSFLAMKWPSPLLLSLACLVQFAASPALSAKDAPLPQELSTYLAKAEPESGWTLKAKSEFGECDYWHLNLKSQVWQDIPWEHDLVIFKPKNVTSEGKMVLLNEGGSFKPDKAMYGAFLANKMKVPVAIVLGVPKQPLFDGKREDDLIAETFIRYLETGDASWPLLFPMVKTVVKAMDAVGEFTGKDWGVKTDKFLLTGASKRGWTTWLTASSDPRVFAIAPMVIDVLNIPAQLPLQMDRFGKPSEQISPYTSRGLIPLGETAAAKRLWSMVDPYTYRAKYTMPKLILLGNNDPYWSPDALNVYWDETPGDKYISYTPNAGHNLMEVDASGIRQPLPMRALDNITAFVRAQFTGVALPKLGWKHGEAADGKLSLTVTADQPAKEARLWIAKSATKDFRKARWESQPLETGDGKSITAMVAKPESGYIAYYADLNYEVDGTPLWLCTQLRLAGEGL
ncbi:MAG: PhoPQ-activated pathogenicity protein [Verrucomicrobiaceae bacterium]|nr:MAG: PhoPQ-activated pathogenicity protein [Verrucomicrobiaceae bacterium]